MMFWKNNILFHKNLLQTHLNQSILKETTTTGEKLLRTQLYPISNPNEILPLECYEFKDMKRENEI